MELSVRLLGPPTIQRAGAEVIRFRSLKSWAILTYLVICSYPPSRSHLASMLFLHAEDPLRALRWNLTELRSGLGGHVSIEGDPIRFELSERVDVDLDLLLRGGALEAARLPGIGLELLEGITLEGAAAFESWLLSPRRLVAARSGAVLHEAGLASISSGDVDEAIDFATRALALNPLDEGHHALLIRAYRLAGDEESARRQYEVCEAVLSEKLGVGPGAVVLDAMRMPVER
ncbi:MAG: BTAD domain-containing putative transcriptional regulator [Halobacteriales archaeon]|nr:BTAD domain-containing putative transcriptional regulator [Halobacteriales archaeon]